MLGINPTLFNFRAETVLNIAFHIFERNLKRYNGDRAVEQSGVKEDLYTTFLPGVAPS